MSEAMNAVGPYELWHGMDGLLGRDSSPVERTAGGLDVLSGGIETAELFGAPGILSPVGEVAGAAALGMEAGSYGSDKLKEWGVLGQTEDGQNRDASDMASDWGMAAGDVLGPVGEVGGTLLGSVVGGGLALGGAIGGLAEDAWSAIWSD